MPLFLRILSTKIWEKEKTKKMKQIQEKINHHFHRYDVEDLLPLVIHPSPKPDKGKRAKSSTKVIPNSSKGKVKELIRVKQQIIKYKNQA